MKTKETDSTSRPDIQTWCKQHPEFRAWWKTHPDSGFASSEGKHYWGIPPWEAYFIPRYRAEFDGKSKLYSEEEIIDFQARTNSFQDLPSEFIPIEREEGLEMLQLCRRYLAGERELPNGEHANDCEAFVFHHIRHMRSTPKRHHHGEPQNTATLPIQRTEGSSGAAGQRNPRASNTPATRDPGEGSEGQPSLFGRA